ncbi:hypothetical protein [Salarchaeum sp. JOR-1]|uniref:hypothetical protein n=1 Tax=Salarchaeum sp. JOR-1 TaxID=2599399 RepID=UPI00119896BD|nr:hypothetical protein [Salarchaeum sp. JOR-1]QDX40006.1 hypothetical protein FQU85_03510 [Salarchaeum sp. JOR-1]
MDTHARRSLALLLVAVQSTALAAYLETTWTGDIAALTSSTLAVLGVLLTAVGFALAWRGP